MILLEVYALLRDSDFSEVAPNLERNFSLVAWGGAFFKFMVPDFRCFRVLGLFNMTEVIYDHLGGNVYGHCGIGYSSFIVQIE